MANYIELLNRFWDWATFNPLPTGQVSLYLALLHINNRSYWDEWFQAPNQVLSILTGLSRSGILTARNGLKQAGLIDVRERGTRATLYCVIANSKQESMQGGAQESNQAGKQGGVQESNQNSGTYIKTKNKNKKQNPPLSPLELFEGFLEAYPKKDPAGRYLVETAYVSVVVEGIAEADLLEAAQNYAEACRIQSTAEQFIKMPANFLRDRTYVRYLPGEYKAPARNSFERKTAAEKYNSFMQNSYDYDALEQELLGGVDDAEKV